MLWRSLPAARRMPATTNRKIVMNEKTVANQMNAANQSLARLMRPSKLKRNQVQFMGKTPDVGRCPRFPLCARRWASTAPNKFQLSQLVPIRGCTRAAIDRRQRVWAKSVGPSCPSQTQHFDKTPEAESDHDEHEEVRRVGIAKPVPHFAEQNRSNEERDDPPAAFVAIVKPLDRGGHQDPNSGDEDRRCGRRE